MRFKIRSVWGSGEVTLGMYSCLEKYNATVEDNDLFITLNSLQDLMNMIKMLDNDIVVSEDELVIYDDYME